MPISLHAAYVPSALQMLGTAGHLLGKAETWCSEQGVSGRHDRRAHHRGHASFHIPVKCVAEHTQGAVEGVRAGVYSPDINPPPTSFAALREKLAAATQFMKGLDEAEMERFVGQPMRFEFKENRLDFTADQFLLSFSQPNFYFHAATAYNILRMKGVGVGKMNFMGRMRLAG